MYHARWMDGLSWARGGLSCGSGDEISSKWNDSGVRIGDSDADDIYMVSCDEPAKLRRAYCDGCGGSGVVTVLTDACEAAAMDRCASGGVVAVVMS